LRLSLAATRGGTGGIRGATGDRDGDSPSGGVEADPACGIRRERHPRAIAGSGNRLIGFFGAAPGVPLNDALAGSSDASHWADAFLTGVAIAAGTKPLHDIASRLRKAKKKQQTAAAPV
jgi:hypothetical protein